ncbi:MAG TPA: hypothetical protein PKI12_01025, partial [Bacteroidales bacterium]|nr:hypothetical protein [Bacteroidales bacterium]
MKVGLTYDLRSWYLDRGYSMEDTAEFDKQETVDAIDNSLRKMGFETEQVGNCFQLISALAAGKKWDLVFNIAEGCLFGKSTDCPRLENVVAPEKLLGVFMCARLVFAGEIQIDIGNLVSAKAQKSLERNVKAVLAELFSADWADFIGHVRSAAVALSALEIAVFALGAAVMG